MEKRITTAFDKTVYLLGKDPDGIYYWLEEGEFACDWYWSGGYIESYTNNKYPARAKDISSHSHFDIMFFNKNLNCFDAFKTFFEDCTLNNSEIWQLCELMKSFYTARAYSDMLYIGGSNIAKNPKSLIISDSRQEYERINKIVIPSILESVYRLLTPYQEFNEF